MRCKRKRDKKATAENFLVVILASGIKANLKFLIVQRLHQTLPVDQRTTIGVPLLPRVSRAFTVNVCFPSGKSGVVYIPLVPVPQSTLRPSNVHSKSACSSDSHVIVCLGLLVSPGFLLVMDITGAFVSKNEEIRYITQAAYTRGHQKQIHLIVYSPVDQFMISGLPLLPTLSTAFTSNECFPSGRLGVVNSPRVPLPHSTARPLSLHSKSASSLVTQFMEYCDLLVVEGFSLLRDTIGAC